eukprot:ANDGO_04359.mRNA.1 hypothetical protein
MSCSLVTPRAVKPFCLSPTRPISDRHRLFASASVSASPSHYAYELPEQRAAREVLFIFGSSESLVDAEPVQSIPMRPDSDPTRPRFSLANNNCFPMMGCHNAISTNTSTSSCENELRLLTISPARK